MGPSFHEVKMKNHALVLTLMTAIAWSTPALAADFPFESIEFDEAANGPKPRGNPFSSRYMPPGADPVSGWTVPFLERSRFWRRRPNSWR